MTGDMRITPDGDLVEEQEDGTVKIVKPKGFGEIYVDPHGNLVTDLADGTVEIIASAKQDEPTKPAPSKGFGDTIKKVTDKLGIKQCGGCKKRQKKINRLFPYKEEDKKES